MLLHKFGYKRMAQIKIILMGDHEEVVAVEFVFIQLIEDSVLRVVIYFSIIQAE
jgi:hypothetical protein